MTSHEDRTENLLTQSLDRQAAQAPRDDDLLDHVHARLRRRRSGRVAGSLVLTCAAVAAGIFGVHSVLDTKPSGTPPATQISPGPKTVEGWRWESYRTIQLQVPSNWGFGTTDQPSCLVKKLGPAYVGRPGVVPAIGCRNKFPDPNVRSPYVWFRSGQAVGVRSSGDGWTEETRELDNVKVTVFTGDDALRKKIFDSVTPIVSVDGNGCPSVVPPEAPRPAGGLASVGTIQSVSVCGYGSQVLEASSKLPADRALSTVNAILAAPVGSGPNQSKCSNLSPVDLLLLVKGSNHDAEVTIRFSGCTDNGASDGTTTHHLANTYLTPLLTGPHSLTAWDNQSGIGVLRQTK